MADVVGPYFIGVDVGTSSVRAALVTSTGRLVCSASSAITMWEPEPTFYEQSSTDIWQACCAVVRVRMSDFIHLYDCYKFKLHIASWSLFVFLILMLVNFVFCIYWLLHCTL